MRRALSAALCCAACLGASFCEEAGWTALWRDDFSGSDLNPSDWTVQEGADVGMCRSAYCTAANVAVHDGQLVLTSRREALHGHNYSSGAVYTAQKRHFSAADGPYRMCVSARLPGYASPRGAAQGLWPAIWMMPDDKSCDPDEGETDILEQVSGYPELYATYHWQTSWPAANCSYPTGHQSLSSHVNLPDWNSTFHEYALERTLDYIAFVYDGNTVLNTSGSPALVWSMPFYLIINTAIGGSWPGEPNASTIFPVTHAVDYVVASRRSAQ